jgi:hypothetical protein
MYRKMRVREKLKAAIPALPIPHPTQHRNQVLGDAVIPIVVA